MAIYPTHGTVDLIERAAANALQQRFVWLAITSYFDRLVHAPEHKLIAARIRPIVAPIAADLALQRAQQAQSFIQFLVSLISGDAMIADLAMRAIRLYAQRFACMSNDAISDELARPLTFNVSEAAAQVLQNLRCIDPGQSNI